MAKDSAHAVYVLGPNKEWEECKIVEGQTRRRTKISPSLCERMEKELNRKNGQVKIRAI